MFVSPKQWKAKEDCPYVLLETPATNKAALVSNATGLQLCYGGFKGQVCFVGRLCVVNVPTRYQDSGSFSASVVGLEQWLLQLEADLREVDPTLNLQCAVRKNVYMEQAVRARLSKDLRLFDANDQRVLLDSVADLPPNNYEAIGSVSLYTATTGARGLSVQLHALQPVP